jgi:hypothetical protein
VVKTAIAIKSCHRYASRRKAQYDTWLKDVDTDFFFLIGEPTATPIPDALMCATPDGFNKISPKILFACAYALQENVTNLLVLDDDTFVHWPRMKTSGFEKYDYLGFVRTHLVWPYMQGSCYWLSERAMQYVAKPELTACDIPDDLAVGRVLHGKVPFTHEHRYQVGHPYPEQHLWPRKDNDIIASHKMSDWSMRECHSSLTH